MGHNDENSRCKTIIEYPIKKPQDSQGYNTIDILSVIKDIMNDKGKEGFLPSFVIGVSFGADLSKWREILHEVFNSNSKDIKENNTFFNRTKKFENAILITDPVSVRDRKEMDVLETDTLKIWLRGNNSSYLHTKMVLIAFKKEDAFEYALVITSKNISYSKSFDVLVPLFSEKKDEEDNGKEVLDYLLFLAKSDEERNNLKNNLPDLNYVKFDVINTDDTYKGRVTEIKFSYDNHWFEDKLWNEVLESDLVISPYLCEEQFEKLCNTKKREVTNKRILTYWNSADKVNRVKDCSIYVGKLTNENQRVKFHAKMYVRVVENEEGKNHTKIWLGSANLTTKARKRNWELLIGIELDDDANVHDYIKTQILSPSHGGNYNNPLIECYQEKCKGEESDFGEEDEELSVENRMYKFALFEENKEKCYEWRVYNNDKYKEGYKVSYEDIGNWIKLNDSEAFVCEDNYQVLELQSSEAGYKYISYKEYKDIVTKNIKKKRDKYYRDIFMRKVSNRGKKDGSKKEKEGMQYTQYPCLYKKMMDVTAKNKEIDIGKEISNLYYGFMDSTDDNEIVKLMKEYIEAYEEGKNGEREE